MNDQNADANLRNRDQRDRSPKPPLLQAVEENAQEEIDRLIANGEDVNLAYHQDGIQSSITRCSRK